MEKYQPVIGLEIHVELKTLAKMFCQCPADYFGKPPNTQVCPVCLGLPGALPVPNQKAVEWTVLLGKALNCQINKISKFDRKHYFYPDLPKGYQISQYDQPIAVNGKFQIPISKFQTNSNNQKLSFKTFRIRRIHLEEDTGKLIHSGGQTLIDFNRSGVPLVEIVTEPDFDNSDDVKRFLEELQVIIRYLDISDCDMEKGTMRLESNVSVRKIGNSKFEIRNRAKIKNQNSKKENDLPSYKVEIKNINSFRFVKQAIDYEIKRQIKLLEKGETPIQETRGFDEKKGVTFSQRRKEEATDYRYFPEPDIPPMVFNDHWLEEITKQVPELPQARLERYVKEFGLRSYDAFLLTRDRKIADYFEKVTLKLKIKSQKLSLKVKNLGQTVANFIVNKKISPRLSEDEFVEKIIEVLKPKEVDEKKLDQLISQLIKLNKKAVEDYKKGKKNAIMFLVGEAMRELKGKGDPQIIISKIKSQLD